jgi:hypothetical protein
MQFLELYFRLHYNLLPNATKRRAGAKLPGFTKAQRNAQTQIPSKILQNYVVIRSLDGLNNGLAGFTNLFYVTYW